MSGINYLRTYNKEVENEIPTSTTFSMEGYQPRLRNRNLHRSTPQSTSTEVVNTPVQVDNTRVVIDKPEIKQETQVKTPSTETAKGKKYTDRSEFVKDLTNAYTQELTAAGLDPSYAKMLVAQDALESNWGKSSLSEQFNFGGIKAVNGAAYTTKETKEADKDGKLYTTTSKFRKFKDLNDYAKYKIALLNNKKYNAFAGDLDKFYERVKAGGYATDPNYVEKLKGVYNSPIFSAKDGGKVPSRIDELVNQFNKKFNK